MSLEGSSALWAFHLVLLVMVHSSEEHRLRPSIEVRITIHNSNEIRTVTCDAGNLSNNNRDTFTISFTIDTQCGSIQGTAQDIAKQCRATFSTSGNAKESISSLLVKGPLPDFLFGSNISCRVRQRQQLEVHQSTEITLCELHSPPSTVQKDMCSKAECILSPAIKECKENTTTSPSMPETTSETTTQMESPDNRVKDCSENTNCSDRMLTVMFAPVEVFLIIIVVAALAITSVLCYKKRRRRNLSRRSSGSHFSSEVVHSPEIGTIPVQLEHSLSPSISVLDVTPLSRAGLGTPSSISLQSYNATVAYV